MSELISRFTELPAYGKGALVVLLLYAIQSEIRFGSRARAMRSGASDRKSTLLVSISAAVPVLGFALAMKANSSAISSFLPAWFRDAVLPGLPATAWLGVALGFCGVLLRLWAVLILRERYTRTLLIQDEHSIERRGPYRWVRHPGYLGSLLVLNGIALASGNFITLLGSLVATWAAYSYRIKVEDKMLVTALGPSYADYRRQVGALLPSLRSPHLTERSQPEV
jgi:protein-S-isoprenylcysteine O-methyltransferase Ste14